MRFARLKLCLVLVVAEAVYLVGNGRTQLFDRDEPRYAQCARQMLRSGDWVVPRLYDQIRAAKPPGIYWCQASAMALFGDNAFAARVPSVLAGLLTATLLGLLLWHAVGPRRAVWSVFVFTTSALSIFAAKVCLTDSVLLAFTTIALACLYRLWQARGGWPAVLCLSAAIGAGGLVKGPFILGVLGSTLAALGLLRLLDRWRKRTGELAALDPVPRSIRNNNGPMTRLGPALLQCLAGVIVVAAMVGPWIYMVHRREPGFLTASRQDAMQHLETGAEGHRGPPGYHLAMIWVTFMPWSLLLPVTIFSAVRHRDVPPIRFALAAVLGTWVFAEALQTKLPHYILAAFPALALLSGDAIVRCLDGELSDLQPRRVRIGAAVWSVAVLAAATVPWWLIAFRFRTFDWATLLPMTILAVLYSAGVLFLLLTGRPSRALACMGIGMSLFAALLFGAYLPRCTPLRLPVRVAQVLVAHDVVHPGQVKMLDYKEPSLAFYQGGTIREAKHSLPEIEHLDTAPPWMVVSGEIWDRTPPDIRQQLNVVAALDGLNYSDALHPVRVLVVCKR